MPNSSPKSLNGKLRSSLHAAFRARARRNSNLWLVYSYKTDRDWLVSGDHQLVHWIMFLEACPDVKTYSLIENPGDLEADGILGYPEALVTYKGLRQEVHIIVDDLDDSAKAGRRESFEFRYFTHADLKASAKTASRWLRVIAFAAGVRGRDLSEANHAVVYLVHQRRSGTLKGVLDDLSHLDSTAVLGVLARLAITGVLRLDLSQCSFGLDSHWEVA
ncbi:hypothetical protein [Ectopseudomonas oleovorans]|uniref:hypothetical protein n=1 Tax=Ectopseudomonas oleovorans TaxID=301 RepID=UPI0011B24A43|nr:hypothetical protein [Pseudomonas indoloxydans]